MSNKADYNIELRESAVKEIRSLPLDVKERVISAISSLSITPHPRGSLKLKGHDSLYRIRVGVYRVVYDINDTSCLIIITRVRHRREVYD